MSIEESILQDLHWSYSDGLLKVYLSQIVDEGNLEFVYTRVRYTAISFCRNKKSFPNKKRWVSTLSEVLRRETASELSYRTSITTGDAIDPVLIQGRFTPLSAIEEDCEDAIGRSAMLSVFLSHGNSIYDLAVILSSRSSAQQPL